MHKRQILLLLLALWSVDLLADTASAQMSYFDDGIEYWKHLTTTKKRTEEQDQAETSKLKKPASQFDWQQYLDPQHDEFFREGDYVPPAPFMEVARNPSDENLRLWFSYIAKRNAISRRLDERMQEFTHNSPMSREAGPAPPIQAAIEPTASPLTVDSQRFALRFYFDSQCPHCRRMAVEIEKLRRLGVQIEGRQVDQGPAESRPPLAIPVQYATAEEIHKQNIQSVPQLLRADLKSKTVYRLSGYQSADVILRALQPGS